MKLLIVDDSSVVRRLIARNLQARFSEIHEAENELVGLELFKAHSPEVVTMDIVMREMDGIQAVESITAINPDTRILIISAMADKKMAITAVEKGARGFLLKPFTPQSLNAAISEILLD